MMTREYQISKKQIRNQNSITTVIMQKHLRYEVDYKLFSISLFLYLLIHGKSSFYKCGKTILLYRHR